MRILGPPCLAPFFDPKTRIASASQDWDVSFFHAETDVSMGIRPFIVTLGWPYGRGWRLISTGEYELS